MKIGIIGAGAVGAACTFATVMKGCASEIILVNRDRDRAKGMVTDMGYGAPLSSVTRITDGEYSDLAGAALVMITVGVNEKTGGATDRSDPQGRLRLLDKNVAVYRDVIPQIVAAAPDAVLLVVTDPPDPLAYLTRQLAGHDRVLSTGTMLDSLRFRVHLGRRLNVAPASIEAQVLGEHGTSQIFHWSAARVGGVPISDALGAKGAEAGGPPRNDRAGSSLRKYHDHRRHWSQPIWNRNDLRPDRRNRIARRTRCCSDRILQFKIWCNALAARHRRTRGLSRCPLPTAIGRRANGLGKMH